MILLEYFKYWQYFPGRMGLAEFLVTYRHILNHSCLYEYFTDSGFGWRACLVHHC